MDYLYNLDTSFNRLSNTSKYPFLKANLWIPLSHDFTGVINPTKSKVKGDRINGKVCIVCRIECLVFDVLWVIDKQFITQSQL